MTFTDDSRKELIDLANARMPFGKYQGKLLIEIPYPPDQPHLA